MVTQKVALEDIRERSLEELLREVAQDAKNLVVEMPDGEQVIIEPKPRLEPLPLLEGHVPEGWKEAVYAGQ